MKSVKKASRLIISFLTFDWLVGWYRDLVEPVIIDNEAVTRRILEMSKANKVERAIPFDEEDNYFTFPEEPLSDLTDSQISNSITKERLRLEAIAKGEAGEPGSRDKIIFKKSTKGITKGIKGMTKGVKEHVQSIPRGAQEKTSENSKPADPKKYPSHTPIEPGSEKDLMHSPNSPDFVNADDLEFDTPPMLSVGADQFSKVPFIDDTEKLKDFPTDQKFPYKRDQDFITESEEPVAVAKVANQMIIDQEKVFMDESPLNAMACATVGGIFPPPTFCDCETCRAIKDKRTNTSKPYRKNFYGSTKEEARQKCRDYYNLIDWGNEDPPEDLIVNIMIFDRVNDDTGPGRECRCYTTFNHKPKLIDSSESHNEVIIGGIIEALSEWTTDGELEEEG